MQQPILCVLGVLVVIIALRPWRWAWVRKPDAQTLKYSTEDKEPTERSVNEGAADCNQQQKDVCVPELAVAQQLVLRLEHETALKKLEQAELTLQSLRQQYPDRKCCIQQLASLQYTKATCLLAAKRPADAITALNASETGYACLREAGDRSVGPLIADVQARRGRAHAACRHGLSACIDLEQAVSTYQALLADGDVVDMLDFARVLTLNASVLIDYGDAELAVRSADHAIRIYVSRAQAINSSDPHLARMHASYMRTASRRAAMIHAANDRLDIALQADDLWIATARSMAPSRLLEDEVALAEALANKALHLQAMSRSDEAYEFKAEASRINAEVVSTVDQTWPTESQRLRFTLRAALEAARRELGDTRVRPQLLELLVPTTDNGRVFTSGVRCNAQIAHVIATELVEIAEALLGKFTWAALRLGLAAHYLFAAASRRQTLAMRYQFADFGLSWAKILLVCARVCEREENLEYAFDISRWSLGVATALIPFQGNDRIKAICDEVLTYHEHLTRARAA